MTTTKVLHEVPLTTLKGVGDAAAKKLERIGIHNLQDLLFHLPIRYQDRTRITPIGSLQFGLDAVFEGHVLSVDIAMGRRRSLVCKLRDGSGSITLRFFHFSAAMKKSLQKGTLIRCFGEPRRGAHGLEVYHPEYRVLNADNPAAIEETLTPIYPATEGITQNSLRNLCQQALQFLDNPNALQEWLPESVRSTFALWQLNDAVRFLHQPPADANVTQIMAGLHPAQQRLAMEELLAHHLSLQQIRQRVRKQNGQSLNGNGQLVERFLDNLPFQPTSAQQRVAAEIRGDLVSGAPMLRLVQGDVGSGKTVVAAVAALQAIESDTQVALMAPTEILAEQHYNNFYNWLKPLGITVAWLTGKTKGKKREEQLSLIASGEAQMIVGTHALFQSDVVFRHLSLAIIDEQHRFGVHQRMALREKGLNSGIMPHQLIMTATPIPRTLAMSAYADLDLSIIDELPPGRTPITTIVIGNDRRPEVIARVRAACLEGRQAYWVCTLIEESEALQCQAAEVTAAELQEALSELSIGLVHGRMKPAEKAQIMAAFKEGHLHLLVATTVIEVGVDVPNSSLMIIENPERLGLAQLHQLRGRVGRGNIASFCVLMYNPPLSQQSKERLLVMRSSNDGFVIAEKDLELRGPGEVLGTRQTGVVQFRIADLQRDKALLESIKGIAAQLMRDAPHHVQPLIDRWLTHGEYYADA